MSEHCEKTCGRKLLTSYIWGFILSVVLVLGAYFIVDQSLLSGKALYVALGVFLVLQMLIQVLFFLRLNMATEDSRWNLIVLLFTLLIIFVVVSGSLWIMYELNYNMVN